MTKLIYLLLFILNSLAVVSQNSIRVMSYNVLTYPQPGITDNRIDTLGKIIRYYQPDLLLLQELKSDSGLIDIVNEFNEWEDNYTSGTYIPQISNPSNSWRLQQNIVYDQDVFILADEKVIKTSYRDINYFKLEILDSSFIESGELPFIHVYVTHLKSSTGVNNEQLRNAMAQKLIDDIDSLPPKSMIIAGGDFNVYSGDEAAYQLLISDQGSNTLNDPIDMPDWDEAGFSNLEILTQSTRSSNPGNGAGGGIDDRFDFIMLSNALMDAPSTLSYELGSYSALGNTGNCYNQDLIDCNVNNPVTLDILRAMWHMSDHIPIVLTLGVRNDTTTGISIKITDSSLKRLITLFPNPAGMQLGVSWQGDLPADLILYDLNGKEIDRYTINQPHWIINTINYSSGLYIMKVFSGEEEDSINVEIY